ncbi:hypothetical protein BHM03_00024998 [Ensete ventricosum]|nr:hypothetical protein BHM03_00024998 [Ensete ventricosum]
MVKHHGESSKMGQAGPLLQAAVGGLQEAPSGASIGKKSHKERLTIAETHLDILQVSLEELYQGQRRFLGVKSSQEEVESQIEKIESLIDQLIKDTKDSVRHLHEVMVELTAMVMG